MSTRPPGYGSEAAAIAAGGALVLLADRGVVGDRSSVTVSGIRAGAAPADARSFEPTILATAGPGEARPACEFEDPEIFFSDNRDTQLAARRICLGCPRRDQCGEAGEMVYFGVWGGLTERERRARTRAGRRQ